ncbi:hypothetical protein GLAREA_06038 [Glarea lozoyensis ATCC 20868]|uniref:Uncharacterized protein n=1 Tax=Glarea lozoyensis (strain ATCC 20868 / MF5171) TaxID=1116229 RepID=S3DLT7_GLAL2|nr:uncharacterized protein GLAREA_06038 [Glarea lozoyensis ATCC 20868]EPE33026.1 hypothetical protein GLAREA_06038 [Glarea lozoyensis ATCC 20868]
MQEISSTPQLREPQMTDEIANQAQRNFFEEDVVMNNNESAATNNIDMTGVGIPTTTSMEDDNKTPTEVAQGRRRSSDWRGSREQRNLIEERRQTWRKSQDIQIQRLWNTISSNNQDIKYPGFANIDEFEEAVCPTPPVNQALEPEEMGLFSVDKDGKPIFSPAISKMNQESNYEDDHEGPENIGFDRLRRRGGVDAGTLRAHLQAALETKMMCRNTSNEAERLAIEVECQDIMNQMDALTLQ